MLISVTTIPAVANMGVATAYTDWAEVGGAAAQLGVNLVALVLGGLASLTVQRGVYEVRLKRHSTDGTKSRNEFLPMWTGSSGDTRDWEVK